ncbi:LytTR family DNA-binding domain-containing protein [Fulvivirgaceae bacterium BMA10]|uniref:LytTR family DNA-binding domain-containing protein n=1 Tax=Splendidivirga corallicola TaxID=3051826 RepID=A0ABT8KXE8_9BACT|nr:LytTR family DNA-binding domain-containing protein [Fulvivirgaceae bacterium BMA10]
MIKAIVVDDEILARKRVFQLLDGEPEIMVIGECRNGEEAIKMIAQKEPDLVFLDIQMPDMDGFTVLSKLKTVNLPYIIFATAFDQYALKAFEVHALDYLLKPFDEDRFGEALKQAKDQIKLKRSSKFNNKLLNLMREFQQEDGVYLKLFSIKEKGRVAQIAADNVLYLEADGNYVVLHTDQATHLYRITMNAIADQLDPEDFLRIHRSYMINRRYILKYKYLNNNEYLFTLKNGQKLISGRTYKGDILNYFEK